jgi:AraC-like DNA-binding protein
MELVDNNIGNANFSVTDITQELGMSRSLLHTKMKNLMNTSAGDYIRHKRIQKACQMITDGHNVSETAYSCGFADPNYFSKVFKKVVGVAPSEYTKQ